MPTTITTRAITIHMRRRRPDEPVDPFRERHVARQAQPLREQLAAWIDSTSTQLGDAHPDMPDGVTDRPAEIWEPLLAIADTAGGHWPHTARNACRHFVLDTGPHITSLGVRLLADLRELFTRAGTDRVRTTDILPALCDLDEAPWGDLNGKPLDARRLAKELSRYGVRPHDVRMAGGEVVKGYRTTAPEGLTDAWDRYLPSPTTAATRATAATPQVSPVAATGRVADASATPRTTATGLTRHVAAIADVAATHGPLHITEQED